MKINSTLVKYVKNMSGSVIGVGINDEDILNAFNKNSKIKSVDLLQSFNNKIDSNKLFGFNKRISVKSLRKKYKKKRIDYMLVNANTVEKYLKHFIKDSIYINNDKIYYFSKTKNILNLIAKRYSRYTKDYEIIKCDDGFILKINTKNTKNKFILDKLYYISDTLYNVSDMISNFLIN